MKARRSRTILIIDDNPVLSTLLQKYAQRDPASRLQVNVASDAVSGYQEACENRPDIILLDYAMPVHDGRAFLDLYAKESRLSGVPVVLHSVPDKSLTAMIERDYPMVKAVMKKHIGPSQMIKALLEHLGD